MSNDPNQGPLEPIRRGIQRPAAEPTRSDQRRPMRRRKNMAQTDQLYVDQAKVPEGMTYEWKRKTYWGKEDRKNMILQDENGFTPVPAKRHPEIVGQTANPEGEIEVGGLVLMERPKELQDEARQEEQRGALKDVQTQMQRLKLTGNNEMDRVVQKANRSYERGQDVDG